MAHHVNTNTGEVSVCKAKKGGCPFGGESGTDNHYATNEEARAGSERLMEATYANINKSYRKKTTGIEIPEKMAQKVIRDAVAGKNKIHPSVAAKVFSTSNSERVRLVAAREVKSQKFLREMSNDDSALVRTEVAKSSNNPAILAGLAKDSNPKVRKAALSNKKIPDRAKTAAANFIKSSSSKPSASDESVEQRLLRGNAAQGLNSTSPEYVLASSTNTHGTDLQGLSNNTDASVRAAVAKNPNTYPETLSKLSHDTDIDVLDAVANNENAHQLHRNIAGNNRNFLKAVAKKKSESEAAGGADSFDGFESFRSAGGRTAWQKDDVTVYDNEDGTYTVQRNGSNMGLVEGKNNARRGADILAEGTADVSTPKKFRDAIGGAQ